MNVRLYNTLIMICTLQPELLIFDVLSSALLCVDIDVNIARAAARVLVQDNVFVKAETFSVNSSIPVSRLTALKTQDSK